MNRLELFEEMNQMYTHNLMCYSSNFLMTKPKKGYEKEWKEQNERLELIQELIEEEKGKREHGKVSLTFEQIKAMYPNTEYFVKNSYGGTIAGTYKLEDAIKYAEEFKKEYLTDPLNNKAEIYVMDKQGNNVYTATGRYNEDEEEFE